ncbi:hypothetical protein Poli38472_014338 [Pythium oligandrum]|uniref:P-type ATPase A domain-containing protein n=1 Tax=Pythium oligandrum TaxID=41045 RepID=A0A8K1FBX9_PYTOL|nr:hypothetical protein Poli38472_014338 [Pythium oligandrum]|eukprot:TMW57735.1 hypothetical protein Poli38472_014338 [Pythium oligandrum]
MLAKTLTLAALTALPLVAATAPQSRFPACPINHNPKFYCCEVSETEKILYTEYNRPTGGPWESYYEEGWKQARQIYYQPPPDKISMYAPDTPEFVYGDKTNMCRMLDVVVNGTLTTKMQCTFEPGSKDGKYFEYNASAADGINFDKFLTSTPNPRNNPAMFPIGAKCYEVKTADEKGQCQSAGFASVFYFTTGKEAELVALYAIYGAGFALLGLWLAFRTTMASLAAKASPQPAGDLKSLEEGSKKLLDNRGGPDTPGLSVNGPSLAMRASEVRLRNSVEDIKQTGYSDSYIGVAILTYIVLLTLLLNVLMIIVILDNNFKFLKSDKYAALFNGNEVLIKVFISLWVVTSVWLGSLVFFVEKLLNFFRVPQPLSKSLRVHFFKPEETELLLADRSGISQFVVRVENFLFPNAKKGVEETVQVFTTSEGARYLEFQNLRYTYDDVEGKFVPGSIVLPATIDQILAESEGLTTEEHQRRLDMVGRNAIEVEMPSIMRSIIDEVFSTFYVYQLMCYYVWYFTDYVWVSVLNTVVIVVSAGVNILTKRSIFSSIVQMTHYQSNVEVKRSGVWKTVTSGDLVPGDLVRIAENWELPCDLVIVKGSTVCDESMLTGESMPVQKFPLPGDSRAAYEAEGSGKKYTLFSGTKTLSSGRDEEILAVVQSTGAHTNRGQLVQAILYPAPMRFKYDEQLKAVVAFLFVFGFVAAYLAMKFLIENAGLSNTLFSFVYGMFMFSAVLNPLLPVVITIGQVNASKRLKHQGIFCLNPQRITLAGKVRVFCFDKTGTITKQGLDFRGYVPVVDAAFQAEVNDVATGALSTESKYALASCHAVGSLKGELVGNEVEVKMFTATQWKLIEEEGKMPEVQSADGSDALEVVKRFEFDHHRMSMSVIMKHKSTGKLYVFCKGSYEKMQAVSTAASVPSDYQSVAEDLAKNGCYVLGMTYKEVAPMSDDEMHAFLANRDAVEEGLSLLGLIMFRNEIKEDSRDAILKLKSGDVRTVMITGDNAMTGCYIARASGMVEAEAKVILGDMVVENEAQGAHLVWKDVDTQEVFETAQIESIASTVELAVTGKAFDHLVKIGKIESLLLNIRIFSRMTPAGKVSCVKLHMASGAVTGMCGDGGNDCGALRIAHVGIALSDAEASVVSPFTSKSKTLQSVVDVIIEGRGALATSFGSVKYLIMYGLIGIGCRFVMYSNGVFISQFGFMYLDGAIQVGLAYAITRCKPLPEISTQRPTSSLVGPTTLFSFIGAWIIHALFLYGGIQFVTSQVWYCPFNPSNVNLVHWWQLQDSNLGITLWTVICFQQMSTGLTMSLGARFRRAVWNNKFLMFYYILLLVLLLVLIVGPPSRFGDQFRISSSTNVISLPDITMPLSFRWKIIGYAIANTAAVMLYEGVIVLGPVRDYFRNRYHKDVLKLKL